MILSPGPGRPQEASDFGIGAVVLRETELAHSLKIPVLGVCLGHQGMAIEFGGTVVHGPEPMHGRVSLLTHSDSNGLFSGIPSPFEAVRYHSLIAKGTALLSDMLNQETNVAIRPPVIGGHSRADTRWCRYGFKTSRKTLLGCSISSRGDLQFYFSLNTLSQCEIVGLHSSWTANNSKLQQTVIGAHGGNPRSF